MTLTDQVIKNIIRKLINGQDYRIEIVTLINAEFLQYAIDFFKQVVDAQLKKTPYCNKYRKYIIFEKNKKYE